MIKSLDSLVLPNEEHLMFTKDVSSLKWSTVSFLDIKNHFNGVKYNPPFRIFKTLPHPYSMSSQSIWVMVIPLTKEAFSSTHTLSTSYK